MSITVPAAIGLLSAAASGVTAYTSSQAQQAQAKAHNEQLKKEALRQYKEIDEAEADTIYQSHNESLQSQRDFLQARSNIEVQSAVTGTYGKSVDVALEDLNTGLGQRMTEITERRDTALDQLTSNAEAAQAGTIMAFETSIQPPSWYTAGSSALSGFETGYRISKTTQTSYDKSKQAK